MARHRRQTGTQRLAARAAVGVLPLAALVTGAATAQAAPQFITPQPGVTNPAPAQPTPTPAQPGVTNPPAEPAAIRTPPPATYVSPADDAKGVAPDSDYNAPIRQVPQRDYITPIQPDTLHAPEPTPQVAEIVPQPRILRAGDMSTTAPDQLSAEQIDQINTVFARPEAELSQFARSLGVAPSRADSVASAAVAGAVAGGLIGCAIGTGISTALIITIPEIPLGCMTYGSIGFLSGAVIGAGVGGLR